MEWLEFEKNGVTCYVAEVGKLAQAQLINVQSIPQGERLNPIDGPSWIIYIKVFNGTLKLSRKIEAPGLGGNVQLYIWEDLEEAKEQAKNTLMKMVSDCMADVEPDLGQWVEVSGFPGLPVQAGKIEKSGL